MNVMVGVTLLSVILMPNMVSRNQRKTGFIREISIISYLEQVGAEPGLVNCYKLVIELKLK